MAFRTFPHPALSSSLMLLGKVLCHPKSRRSWKIAWKPKQHLHFRAHQDCKQCPRVWQCPSTILLNPNGSNFNLDSTKLKLPLWCVGGPSYVDWRAWRKIQRNTLHRFWSACKWKLVAPCLRSMRCTSWQMMCIQPLLHVKSSLCILD